MEQIVLIVIFMLTSFVGYCHGHKIGYMKGEKDAIDKMQKVRVRK